MYIIYGRFDCNFCKKAANLLIEKGKAFQWNALEDGHINLDLIKDQYSHYTIPIILHLANGNATTWEHPDESGGIDFVGGYTELVEWLKE